MDTAQWPQGIGVVTAVENTRPTAEKKPRALKEQALNCPRCNSTNTKFCYYNNYSLSQPRYFCKTCRRYWTEGGTLRSVPVGGGSRKNKRPSSSSSSSSINSNSKKLIPNLSPPKFSQQNPKIQHGKDLNLGYNPTIFNGMSQFASLPFGLEPKIFSNPHENPNYNPSSNIMSSSLTNSMSGSNYSASFLNPLSQHDQLFKPSLNFSLDGLDHQNNGGYGNNLQSGVNQEHADSSSRTLNFPFEELKPVAASDDHFEMQDGGQAAGDSSNNGYWINGMLAAGGMLSENNYI